ncbi:hypothetical protein AAE485_13815 [Acidithiobacillus ferriphilus]|uniref:hypothetical protein n=1 Tax=Acidithiobacillus ferriphilus TaxID=1689834 RepID=UPI003CC81F84
MMGKKTVVTWLEETEAHDYPAAASYLSLLYDATKVTELITSLETAVMTNFLAKDIFRASGLSLLGVSNSHVQKDIKKVRKGIPLSPLLLARDQLASRLIIADGYHRLCAVYTFDEDAVIPCKLV